MPSGLNVHAAPFDPLRARASLTPHVPFERPPPTASLYVTEQGLVMLFIPGLGYHCMIDLPIHLKVQPEPPCVIPPPVKKAGVDDEDRCIICFENVPDCNFIDCKHKGFLCAMCADGVMKRSIPCPLCRGVVSGFRRMQDSGGFEIHTWIR